MIMNTFTAVDPAGKAHTRTSKTRTYTHTVVGLPNATRTVLMAQSAAAKRTYASDFAYHMARANGTSPWLARKDWETEVQHMEREAKEVQASIEDLGGCDNRFDYVTLRITQCHDRVRELQAQGYYDTYQNFGWCGRADLAAKLKIKSENRNWLNVMILEVN